jgi:lipoprotein-anchoring transpeptidase ErfK/SrfK
MKLKLILLIVCIALVNISIGILMYLIIPKSTIAMPLTEINPTEYWLVLERKSNRELLYQGTPGDSSSSTLIKVFQVKVGIPDQRPTPLPEKLNREYWLITNKFETQDSQETAPYFLTLDIPYSEEFPYGPVPYNECNGQCNWQLPGSFGLHGVASDSSKLAAENLGSSGCIRHHDQDIAFLYQLLDPETKPIKYYIQDI